jgi:crotonobetainyl-CoA:carnitine CoA-transferase CaiB-like acyl-CoA transferase
MRLWLRDQDADVAMQRLQAVGVPAGKMLRVADLQDFGYFRERDFFRVDSHPYMNEHIVAERAHAGSQFLAEPDNRPAPLMGEHSALVVGDWLGLDRATLAGLFAADVLEPIAPTVAQLIASGQGRGQLDLVDKA